MPRKRRIKSSFCLNKHCSRFEFSVLFETIKTQVSFVTSKADISQANELSSEKLNTHESNQTFVDG